MNRREAIKRTALILGYSVSSSALAGIFNGCKAEPGDGWSPSFLTRAQSDLVAEISELILPRTDTPGAKDLLVHRFIDQILNQCHTNNEQEAFLAGLRQVDKDSKARNGKSFLKLSPEQQSDLLKEYDHELKEYIDAEDLEDQKNLSEVSMVRAEDPDDDDDIKPFFYKMKELTLLGYFTTEEVGENILSYDPIPGEYLDCIDVDEVGNQWSL